MRHEPRTPVHRELLAALRTAFPQPVSDPVHDAYFVFSILRALEQVDGLKSQTPLLGGPIAPDTEGARGARLEEQGKTLEQVIPLLVDTLRGMFIWGHPRSQVNVVPQPSIASIIGVLLPATYNPNLCSEESSQRFAEAEVRAGAMVGALVGFDPQRMGAVFTFGGSGGVLYGARVGLEKALGETVRKGIHREAVLVASQASHYCCLSAAAWLGLGQERVVSVATHPDNSIQLGALEAALREAIGRGARIGAIVATMGTTDSFGIDDLAGIHALRERLVQEYQLDYRPHIHADAVIGWAWSVFNDYDFLGNPLGFRGRTVRALAAAKHRLQHLGLADSVGVDFHKTGFTPYISSLVAFRERLDLESIGRPRVTMPFLFQSGEYHPGMYTLETSRSGMGPMAALGSMLLLGKQGYRVLLGHAVEMAEVLREAIESHPNLSVLNGENVGPVTLFRAYPDGVDTFSVKQQEFSDPGYRDSLRRHNEFNRRIFARVHREALAGEGVVISLTDNYRSSDAGEPIVALKSYVLSPFSDESRMESIIEHVLKAREQVTAEME